MKMEDLYFHLVLRAIFGRQAGHPIYRFRDGAWEEALRPREQDLGRVVDLRLGPDGALWTATLRGLWVYQENKWRVLPRWYEMPRGPILSICPTQDGGLWMGTRSGAYKFNGETWSRLRLEVAGPVFAIEEADDGSAWLGVQQGIVQVTAGVQRHFSEVDGLPGGPVIDVLQARDGEVWISTLLEGVARFDGSQWKPVPRGKGTIFSGVSRMFQAIDGTIWLASRVGGAIQTDGEVWTHYTTRHGLPGSSVWDVCQDTSGQIWFATSGGFGCYLGDKDPPETVLIAPPERFAPNQAVLIRFAGQDVWKQTPTEELRYAWRLDEGAWSLFSHEDWALLPDLTFGEHTFAVRAMDREFNVDSSPAVHSFVLLAPVWRRPWFVGLSLVSLAAIAASSGYAWVRHRHWRKAPVRLIDELESELERAHDLQMGLLPAGPIRNDRLEIAGRCAPANHVGGDYFSYFWLDESQDVLGFGVADVSGKAMDAAVRVMQLSGIFRYEFSQDSSSLAVMESLNRIMQEQLDEASFLTCCLGKLDLRSGLMDLANAGHPFPYHFSAAAGDLSALEMPSLSLGVKLPPGSPGGVAETEVRLNPGDLMVLYSDGVTDTQDEEGRFYENWRLEALIRRHVNTKVEEIVQALLEDLKRFKGGAPQLDDLTVLALRVPLDGGDVG